MKKLARALEEWNRWMNHNRYIYEILKEDIRSSLNLTFQGVWLWPGCEAGAGGGGGAQSVQVWPRTARGVWGRPALCPCL